jgi:urocanate hydratase
MAAEEAIKLVLAINHLVARGEIKAPVAIGRSIRRNRSASPLLGQPPAQAANSSAVPQPLADGQALERALAALLDSANGASWLSLQAAAGPDEGLEPTSSFVVLADGKPKMAERLARLFANDFTVTNSLFRARSKDPGGL